VEELQGNLTEIFEKEYSRSPRRANWNFVCRVIAHFRHDFIRPLFSRQLTNPFIMMRHHLIVALRGVLRYKSAFAINIIGLTSGLASAMLIVLWVMDEIKVNRHNAKDPQLYQVLQNVEQYGGIRTGDGTPGILADALANEVPEVEFATSVVPPSWFERKGTAVFEGKRVKAPCQFADQSFTGVFSINITHGSPHPLSDKYQVAISNELAIRLFENVDDAIGKTFEYRWEHFHHDYQVASIFQSLPASATEQFDVLLNYENFLEAKPWLREWGNSDPRTYIILREGTDAAAVSERLKDFIKLKLPGSQQTLFIQRYGDRYLHGRYENGVPAGGRIEYVRLFSVIAIFIVFIACINFMNLSTARASRRMKEVGVKKTLGASRHGLTSQFMIESFAITFIALGVSLVLVVLLLPVFNNITAKAIIMPGKLEFYLVLTGIGAVTAVLSGSYPALYLSAFQPGDVLKGKLPHSFGEQAIRKGLVVFQYTLSTVLIVVVTVLYLQIGYVQSTNLGYNRELVVQFEMEIPAAADKGFFEPGGTFEKSMDAFLVELRNTPGVLSAANFFHDVTGNHGALGGVDWEAGDRDNNMGFNNLEVGYDFLQTLDIQLKEGRQYSRDLSNEREKVMLNETAIAAMGLIDPVGTTIKVWGKEREIIGIVKDFHIESLYESVKPTLIQLEPRGYRVMVRLNSSSISESLSAIRNQFESRNPGIPFEYNFLDDVYASLYTAEQRVSTLAAWFASLAVVISCLGLFGLIAFTVERRMKEMSIRKVFGANSMTIVRLLSSDFIRLIGLSLLAGLPLGYAAASYWLSDFAYRMELSWWIFAGAAIALVLITFLTTLKVTMRAASSNPLDVIRTE
jgi:ABC-type antimicrobial peptide transport system permease subunit